MFDKQDNVWFLPENAVTGVNTVAPDTGNCIAARIGLVPYALCLGAIQPTARNGMRYNKPYFDVSTFTEHREFQKYMKLSVFFGGGGWGWGGI